ncbi:hypothetical protein BBJ28_00010988 [Nothophytophthora sp. Chile5]|nr:hypothetical protein BBJ28_00010988 [Nothophytophthora sp. Chile5]
MIDSDMEAILVKVASIGLLPHKHLGKTIAELQPQLMTLVRSRCLPVLGLAIGVRKLTARVWRACVRKQQEKYQLNVCGEGGEYETLTLDCPLFKKRIIIDACHTVLHSDDYVAPVAFLAVDKCHLEDKAPPNSSQLASRLPPPAPSSPAASTRATPVHKPAVVLARSSPDARAFAPKFGQFRDQLCLAGVMSSKVGDTTLSLEDEMADVVAQVKATLTGEGLTLGDICFLHLYVQDMATFTQINDEYVRYLGQNLPPSRSCVEVAALANVPARVLVDCFALRGSGAQKLLPLRVRRDVLHVKSISAWAPCCIGPYSQANVLHRALILLAGQIALLPQTMELVGVDHAAQTAQCFRNACRVLEALQSNLRHVCSGVIYTTGATNDPLAWERLLADCRRKLATNVELRDEFEHVEDSDESDDDVDKSEERVKFVKQAPLLVIQLSRLPRNALVEVELQALTHMALKYLAPRSSTCSSQSGDLRFERQHAIIPRALCQIMVTASVISQEQQPTRLVPKLVAKGIWKCVLESLVKALLPWDRVLHVRIFYVATAFASELELAMACRDAVAVGKAQRLPAMTFVPVDGIQGDAQIALQVTAQDLDKLETELWLHKQI